MIDVLMVWHSHMLNPRAFLEDCIRYGKMHFWATEFPLAIINECLSQQNLEYGRWSAGSTPIRSAKTFEGFYGFADKSLNVKCHGCQFIITHDTLKVAKFRDDLRDLLNNDMPMPGTFYNARGIPKTVQVDKGRLLSLSSLFPNTFLKVIGREILTITSPQKGRKDINQVRDELQRFLNDRKTLKRLPNRSFRTPLRFNEKIAFRRMMASYWDNVSRFSMDLVGAVIRQGTFVEKMDRIVWLHSPTVMGTMDRLIEKYRIFFQIMVTNPRNMAVPTLDVDLAWHTHQLSASRYFEYSTFKTS